MSKRKGGTALENALAKFQCLRCCDARDLAPDGPLLTFECSAARRHHLHQEVGHLLAPPLLERPVRVELQRGGLGRIPHVAVRSLLATRCEHL